MSLHHLFMLCLLPILTPLVSALIGVFIGLVYSAKYFDEDKKKGRH